MRLKVMCWESTTELELRKRELKHNFRDYILQFQNLILISREKQGKNTHKKFILAEKIM